VIGSLVDQVVSSLGYPVYVLLFLGILKIVLAAGSHALVGTDPINLVYPIIVMLLTLISWALRPPGRMLAAATA
jgi:hypothetical protein